MIESGIIAALLANVSLAAKVAARVYPVDLPQGAILPALTVVRVSGGPLYADDGAVGLDNGRIQVDCWADNYTAAKALPALVRAAITDAPAFLLVEQQDERDARDEKADGAEYPFHVILDFDVWERT